MLWSDWFGVCISFFLFRPFFVTSRAGNTTCLLQIFCVTAPLNHGLRPKKEVTPLNKNIAISKNLTILQEIIIWAEPIEAFFKNSIFAVWGTRKKTAAIWDTLRPLPPTAHPKDYRKAQPKPEQRWLPCGFQGNDDWKLTSTTTFNNHIHTCTAVLVWVPWLWLSVTATKVAA